MSKPQIFDIPLEQITPDPNQPRKYFNEETVEQLAKSISVHGLLQPILVRPCDDGKFQIVHGERRYRACLKLGLPTIRAFVKELSDVDVRDIQLTENIERDNLTDIELAWEFKRRVNQGQTHEEIAKVINRSRTFVTQRLALLKLPKKEQERMVKGELSFSNARMLLSIKDPNIRERISEQIGNDTTVKQTLELIRPQEDVTRVTFQDPMKQYIDVSELEALQLITNAEHGKVSVQPLMAAYIRDLAKLRSMMVE